MMDDEMLEDDELTAPGIPLLEDEDGDVGILPEEEDDELEGMTIKGEDGEEEEPS